MKDENKTREQLIQELQELRKQNQTYAKCLMDTQVPKDNCPKETILVVDDNQDTRTVIVAMLEGYGYKMLEADSSQKALDLFNTHTPPIDLVLADVVMPDASGPEIVESLLKIRSDLKVVFMSGYAEDEIVHDDVFKVLHSEASFIKKPFTFEDIGKIIRKKLDKK